jgi:hypothetical protein
MGTVELLRPLWRRLTTFVGQTHGLGRAALLLTLGIALLFLWPVVLFVVALGIVYEVLTRVDKGRRLTRRAAWGASVLIVLVGTGVVAGSGSPSSPKAATPTARAAVEAPRATGSPAVVAAVPVAIPSETVAAAAPTSTATAAPTASPKPTPRPTAKPTPKPTPRPTAKPAVKTGVYGNPWGYDFRPGNVISNPPDAFCSYFPCIASFWDNTNGYVMQCGDMMFSHSGGRSGSCSRHGGNYRALHRH